jgi:hypothetical protein
LHDPCQVCAMQKMMMNQWSSLEMANKPPGRPPISRSNGSNSCSFLRQGSRMPAPATDHSVSWIELFAARRY